MDSPGIVSNSVFLAGSSPSEHSLVKMYNRNVKSLVEVGAPPPSTATRVIHLREMMYTMYHRRTESKVSDAH